MTAIRTVQSLVKSLNESGEFPDEYLTYFSYEEVRSTIMTFDLICGKLAFVLSKAVLKILVLRGSVDGAHKTTEPRTFCRQ